MVESAKSHNKLLVQSEVCKADHMDMKAEAGELCDINRHRIMFPNWICVSVNLGVMS